MKKLNLWKLNEQESELFYNIVNNYNGKMQNHSDKPAHLLIHHKLLLTGNILIFSDLHRLPQVLRKITQKEIRELKEKEFKETSYSPYTAPFSTSFKKGRLSCCNFRLLNPKTVVSSNPTY